MGASTKRLETMSRVKVLYVLGMSYSGSSLLGFVLGAVPEVWNLGEVKVFPREHKLSRICTCKKPTLECEYWGALYRQNLQVFNKGSRWMRWSITLRLLLGLPVKAKSNHGDAHMLAAALEHAKSFESRSTWLVDTSKSLWRLLVLWTDPDIEVKVIYLKRGAKENIASYRKHGHGFFKALFQYALFHLLAKRWLRRYTTESQSLTLHHEDLALREQEAMKSISAFMELDYSGYKEQMKSRVYHIRTGNPRTVDQFRDGFEGFFYDEHWKDILKPIQLNLLTQLFRSN